MKHEFRSKTATQLKLAEIQSASRGDTYTRHPGLTESQLENEIDTLNARIQKRIRNIQNLQNSHDRKPGMPTLKTSEIAKYPQIRQAPRQVSSLEAWIVMIGLAIDSYNKVKPWLSDPTTKLAETAIEETLGIDDLSPNNDTGIEHYKELHRARDKLRDLDGTLEREESSIKQKQSERERRPREVFESIKEQHRESEKQENSNREINRERDFYHRGPM